MNNSGDIFFEIDSRLLTQLGERLVTNRAIALAELIKNSYDADATKVSVSMNNVSSPGGEIIIEDNGLGMTLLSFKKTWMRIATIDKEQNPVSPKYKRKKAGEKGIGRFACRRLAKKLKLVSIGETEDGIKEELSANFDWEGFSPGSDVDKIPIEYTNRKVGKNNKTGTKIILENTIGSWSTFEIDFLRNELAELIAPITFKSEFEFGYRPKEYDPGFIIEFHCEDFPSKTLSFDRSFLRDSWAQLIGNINDKGIAQFSLKVFSKEDMTYTRESSYKFLKNTQLTVFIFPYVPELFKNSEWGLNKIRELGRERGGIKVYADKFRIFGYGQKGDDWLNLDLDRSRSLTTVDKEVMVYAGEAIRPGLQLFGSNQIFGHVVFSSKDNPGLEITVNRERIIEGKEFDELRTFVRLGIDFVTVRYANWSLERREEEAKKKREKQKAKLLAEEEARKKAEEARLKAEHEAKEAEIARKKAEEKAQKAEEELRIAEKKRRQAEEERRKAEEERRKAESDAVLTKRKEVQRLAEEARRQEEEKRKAEKAAIKFEEEKRKAEKEEKRQTQEEFKFEEERIKKHEEEKRRAEEDYFRILEIESKKVKELYEYKLSQLRVLASTGTLVLIFSHEIQAIIEDMEEIIAITSLLLEQLPESDKEDYNDEIESFKQRTEMIKELGEFVGFTVGKKSRLEKKPWILKPIIEKVFQPFRWYMSQNGIDYDYKDIPDNIRTPEMSLSELVAILHNLISNSFKAVKGRVKRLIKVRCFEKNEEIHIKFLDTGIGLDQNLWEAVFEPFKSYSEPDIKFGAGTGLGLSIVRDIVRSYDGDVKFIKPTSIWNTCIEVILPKRL